MTKCIPCYVSVRVCVCVRERERVKCFHLKVSNQSDLKQIVQFFLDSGTLTYVTIALILYIRVIKI